MECKGCTEKNEFVDLLIQNLDAPILKGRENESTGKGLDNEKDDKLQDILKDLEKVGLGGTKVFSAKDFEGLSSEEISKKFGGGSTNSHRAKTPRASKPKMDVPDEEKNEL